MMVYEDNYDKLKMSQAYTADPAGYRAYDPEYPLHSINQVFAKLNEAGNDNKYKPLNEAKINIYLYRGVHHYIDCRNPDIVNLPKEVFCGSDLVMLCFNEETLNNALYVEPQGGGPGGGGPGRR